MKDNINGWYLPKGDNYFPKFCAGPAKKQNGFQREHLLEAFKHVRKWRVAIDVGAHVGFWAKDMAEKFGIVICFEAAQTTFECLKANMQEYPNVVLHNLAVGDKPGFCDVKDGKPGNTGSRYVVPGVGTTQMVALDDWCESCDLLKVDVEGYELAVLQGARKLIKRSKPVIIMETGKKYAKDRYGVPEWFATQWLWNNGYKSVAKMQPDEVFKHWRT